MTHVPMRAALVAGLICGLAAPAGAQQPDLNDVIVVDPNHLDRAAVREQTGADLTVEDLVDPFQERLLAWFQGRSRMDHGNHS